MKRWRGVFWLGCLLAGLGGMASAQLSASPVVIVPVQGTVDDGMTHLVQRSVAEANAQHAAAIVLDVDSPGGLTSAALDIRDALFTAHEPVIAYIDPRAYSAAALVALAANRIIMAPGATIGGDAEPIALGGKTIADLRDEFESTAQRNHRDPTIAGAMIDRTVDAPDYKRPGSLLTLNATDALRAHIADGVAPTLDDALAQSHLAGAPQVTEQPTFGEQIARFATDPIVSAILLALGMLGLLIEMQTLHGIAGTIGVAALALFFGAHVYAGFSNGLVIALAVLGLFGIIWELHVVPGHGVPGILGVAALLAAAFLAFGLPFLFVAVEVLATAIVMTVIGYTLVTRATPRNAWAHRLALASAQGPEYVASPDYSELFGKIGTAASFLRPAGIATIDGRRIDVLTKGEFIPQGTPIRVIRIEGARVFVEPISLPSYRE
jgi:membrane-bound serine protease (ClpP class)